MPKNPTNGIKRQDKKYPTKHKTEGTPLGFFLQILPYRSIIISYVLYLKEVK